MNSDDEKKSKINKIVELVNNSSIASIKQTVKPIINIINDPNSNAKDLMEVIVIDPPLSAKLLRFANSAFYGFSRTVSEIQDAIVYIGFDAIKELALSQKVCDVFKKRDYLEGGYSSISLWKHSVAVAHCGKLIYRGEFWERGENVYAGGLLHDIGIIVLDQFLHDDFIEILGRTRSEKNNLINVENDVLGFNHTDIGLAMAENWGFPDELVMAIGNHHNPDRVDDKFTKIVSTIFVSRYITQGKKIGYSDSPYENKTLFRKCLMKLKIKEEALNSIIKEVKEEIKKMEKAGWF